MSEKKIAKTNKSGNADWFVQGILSKIGDIFDRMTGRGGEKASSLSTSELNERLKALLDSEVKDLGKDGKFVPHNIKLKMQWNKFSTDSEESLKKLQYELLASAIDHINDNLYHTYKPLKIEVKPDYFTEGIKFLASFGEFGDDESEAEVNVTVPQMKLQNLTPEPQAIQEEGEIFIAEFTIGEKRKVFEIKFNENKKRIGVGRTRENDLVIEDDSISKIHAALVLNPEKMLLVADTGSTNGTFINGQRIAYGRAFPIGENDKVKFGTVEVFLRKVPKQTDFATQEGYTLEPTPTEAYQLPAQPTEAYQLPTQNAENLLPQTIASPIPIVPESKLEESKKETISSDIIQPETLVEPNLTNSELPKETEINPTEPRIKLNFDE